AGLVVEDRPLYLATDAADLVDARRPLHEREVGAGGQVGVGAPDRLVERAAVRTAGVGARDEDEVGIELAAHRVGGAILAHRLLQRDHATPGHVAAALGDRLVLDVDAGHARADVLAHRAYHVDGVAVPVVGVGDHRRAHRAGDVARVQVHLGHRRQAGVGQA